MNEQNCRYWAPNNPHEHRQRLPLNTKVTARVQFLFVTLMVPLSSRMQGGHAVTVNTVWYKVMLETFLQPCQVDLVCFQQDRAAAHMAQMQYKFSVHFQEDSFLVLRDITWLTC
jgi:hypothetical protein